jgi:hypothetical protein
MRTSPRSEQKSSQLLKAAPREPTLEITSVDLLMMLEELGGTADLDDIASSLRKPS